MKKVVEVEDTPIGMEIVQEILQGSAQIDKMRKDIKDCMSLLCGLIKKILEEKDNPKGMIFSTEDKDGFYWRVDVYSGGFDKGRHSVYIGAYFGYICYGSDNSSMTSIDAARVEVVWTALPSLFWIVREHIPEIDQKLAPFRKAGKR